MGTKLFETTGRALLGALVFSSTAAWSGIAADDPAVFQVRALTVSLVESMRTGDAESMTERFRQLKPVIERVFAIPLMTRLSVGPSWTQFSAEQQQALVTAFGRYTIANYAHNFRSFDGQKFAVDEHVLQRGPEKVVRATIDRSNGSQANMLYLMEKVNGAWRVVDVYYNGISQLALHRTDFASAIGSGGAPVLIAHLNKVGDDLMK